MHGSSAERRAAERWHSADMVTDPKLTPHSLRHSFGTDLVEAGVDIRVVQELMMHEDLTTTQIYTGVSSRRKREGIELLQRRAIPSTSGRAA